MNILEKYILLVGEYKLLTEKNVVLVKKSKLKYFSYQELAFKITLLRKFMMRDEEMYIINVLNELKNGHKRIS